MKIKHLNVLYHFSSCHGSKLKKEAYIALITNTMANMLQRINHLRSALVIITVKKKNLNFEVYIFVFLSQCLSQTFNIRESTIHERF